MIWAREVPDLGLSAPRSLDETVRAQMIEAHVPSRARSLPAMAACGSLLAARGQMFVAADTN